MLDNDDKQRCRWFIFTVLFVIKSVLSTLPCYTSSCLTHLTLTSLSTTSFSPVLDLICVVLLITDPKCTRSTADVASKRPRWGIDLKMKWKVIWDSEGRKSVSGVTARRSGVSHSTTATVLKNKTNVMEAGKGSASLRATRLTDIQEGPVSDMEKLVMAWMEGQSQNVFLSTSWWSWPKQRFITVKEEAGPDYHGEFTASAGWFKGFQNRHSFHNVWVVSLWVLMWRQLKDCWKL